MTQKFATRSTCLTYEFTTDELGFKEITQVRKAAKQIGFYLGQLTQTYETHPRTFDPNLQIWVRERVSLTHFYFQLRQLPYSEKVGLDHEYK